MTALDDARLDALRRAGDRDADDLVARLRAGHEHLDDRDLVRLILDQVRSRDPGPNPPLHDWLFAGPDAPDWFDAERVRAGQDFFADWALPICTLLFCAALPQAYAAADGVQVLALTSDLATGDLRRRIAETGQMLVDVMDLGGERPEVLRPGGQGYLTLRGVRLLHAAVRQVLTAGDTAGDASTRTCDEGVVSRWCDDWGVPVNQEDLLGTLLTFTVCTLRGLDRLGIPYDPAAADAYLHTWCVVGALLGIHPDLLPIDRAEAERLADLIARRHHRHCPAGERLMAVLLAEMELAMPRGLRRLPATLVRHVVPRAVADVLRVPPAAWWSPLLELTRAAGPVLGRLPGGRRVLQAPSALLGRSMIRMFVDRSLRDEQPVFRIDAVAAADLAIATSVGRRRLRDRRRAVRVRRQEVMAA
ncbi:MAG TPA: oxygenase MpaB family protein [Acidimicrobiales bacterium]|nr:oxygenase MpaB family protein [Acidimicrobiales bacterium]